MKKIDIVHYHLKPGGVTKIIQSQIESLHRTGDYDIRLFCAECPDQEEYASKGVELVCDEAFDYADFNENDKATIEQKMEKTRNVAEKYFSADRIIHFHNLNLGKNPYWTLAVFELAEKGINVVNHVHDFAEDRKDNQTFLQRIIQDHFEKNLKTVMYPDFSNYHIAALSRHDYERIKQHHFSEKQIHYLPNPVDMDEVIEAAGEDTRDAVYHDLGLDAKKSLVTYPVRGIRRKNIGEFILLAHLFADLANFVMTLPPQNPVEKKSYDKWKAFCEEKQIPVTFEAGQKTDFVNLITSSDFCITTSVREGFGMVFLEPWMMSTPVIGRNLKNITKDLIKEGIEFPGLYNFIRVPYKGDLKDFAEIHFDQQKQIISKIIEDKMMANIIFVSNSHLKRMFQPVRQNIMSNNQAIIKEKFSIKSYAERLRKLYSSFAG
jgi:glycosyltransferase involved in cell wall biosynthesis